MTSVRHPLRRQARSEDTADCKVNRDSVSESLIGQPSLDRREGDEHVTKRMASHRFLIIVMFVFIALATRLAPISISEYPFNNDGITECRVAQDIMDSGSLSYPDGAYYVESHITLTPVYDVMLASVSSMLGTSPFWIAQAVVAAFAVVIVLGTYTVVLGITSSHLSAMTSGFVVSFLGSFVYLTGSTWKVSLGVVLLVLIIYAYIRRSEFRMFLLVLIILLLVPIVHHLVAAVAYLALWYLTALSVVFALRARSVKPRHVRDLAGISTCTAVSYLYYYVNSLDRLSYFDSLSDIVLAGSVLGSILFMGYWYLNKESRFRISFAPFLALAVVVLVVVDYLSPVFRYEQSTPSYVLILAVAMATLVGIGWFGIELMVESRSLYRAIPIGLLIPVLLFFSLAIFTESGLRSHWLTYRTYDFIDIPLAIGAGAAVKLMASKTRRKSALILVLTAALVASFPFGYATNTLTGVRHDTQQYEVDAMSWVYSNYGVEAPLQSDERLSYNAQAIFDFVKDPYLPLLLSNGEDLGSGSVNLFLDEWCTIGVNNYPWGRALLDRDSVQLAVSQSNVIFVGGPVDNRVTVFES